jgi:hypothetical protein
MWGVVTRCARMGMGAGCSPPSSLEPELLVVAVMEATRPVDPALDPG